MKKTLLILGIVVVIILIWGFSTYNSIVTANVQADTQWKQVEVEYQRRFDLIPNLVNQAKGVMKQEQAIFTAIADARSRYAGAQSSNEKVQAANQLESSLGRLLVITENYPELKSSEVVQSLMAENAGAENRISVERSRFNKAVEAYNLKVKRVPSSIIAAITGFDARDYFNAVTGAEVAPQTTF